MNYITQILQKYNNYRTKIIEYKSDKYQVLRQIYVDFKENINEIKPKNFYEKNDDSKKIEKCPSGMTLMPLYILRNIPLYLCTFSFFFPILYLYEWVPSKGKRHERQPPNSFYYFFCSSSFFLLFFSSPFLKKKIKFFKNIKD